MAPKTDNSKKSKLYSSRAIRTQLDDSSFQNNEKLNIPEFLKSRTFEIKSFEMSQLNTKYASANRVFQNLPRTLRRRTASHNVKRIPKRLRNRAIKEMKTSSNGIAGLNKKQIRGRNLYRLKMTKKLLKLASKIKLMKNLPDDEIFSKKLNLRHRLKLINEQVDKLEKAPKPIFNNPNGSYDNTGINAFAPRPRGNIKYFKRQTEFVWLPTHIYHAKRFQLIKNYGFQIPLSPTQKCFRSMNRYKKQDAVLFDSSYYNILILEAKDMQNLQKYLLLLTRYKKNVPKSLLNGTVSYDDWLFVEGKRIGKGLIYCSQEEKKILVRVFPSLYEELFIYLKSQVEIPEENIYDCRYSLGNLELRGPLSLNSLSKVFHLPKDSTEPGILNTWYNLSKLNDTDVIPSGSTLGFFVKDPRLWKRPVQPATPKSEESMNSLVINLASNNHVDETALSKLLCNKERNATYKDQLSIKSIGKIFSKTSPLFNSIEGKPENENLIPILITKLESGSWNLILPWFWLLPLWSKLTLVPRIKIGGYNQLKQFDFESNKHHFPNDYQYLRDGWLYNMLLENLQKEKHQRRPKSVRKEYEIFEGALSPFHSDWVYLHKLIMALKAFGNNLPDERRFAEFNEASFREVRTLNDLLQEVKDRAANDKEICISLYEKSDKFHQAFKTGDYEVIWANRLPSLPVVHIMLSVISGGSIKDNARIYKYVSPDDKNKPTTTSKEVASPPITSLIGFVTSGTFNLDLGIDTGVGLVAANYTDPYVLIRNVGCSNYYVAHCKYT